MRHAATSSVIAVAVAATALCAGAQTATPGQAAAPSTQPAMTSPSQTAAPAKPSMAPNSSKPTDQLSAADKKFAQNAALGGIAEVQEGQLAAQKASDPAVKEFAEKMVADHSKANDKLKQIAASKNLELPSDAPTAAKRENDKLSRMSGAAFDREYIHHQATEHKKVVAEFKAATRQVRDPDLKQFAEETLPTIEQHLEMANGTKVKAK